MGIKGLSAVLRQRAPKSIRRIKLVDITGPIVFDASLYLYRWHMIAVKNREGKLINHLQGALFNVNCARKYGLSVHYVFDGKPPDEKLPTLELRKAARAASTSGHAPTATEWSEFRTLLQLMGIQTIDAPGEADPYIAALTRSGAAFACATDDLDALTFGATRVLTDIDCTRGTATLITLQDALEGLNMDYEQFIDFCILLGSDYTMKTLPRIGPARAYSKIREYRTIDAIIASDSTIIAPPEFDYVSARAVFTAPPPALVALNAPAEWNEGLREWLASHGLTGKRIDNLFSVKV